MKKINCRGFLVFLVFLLARSSAGAFASSDSDESGSEDFWGDVHRESEARHASSGYEPSASSVSESVSSSSESDESSSSDFWDAVRRETEARHPSPRQDFPSPEVLEGDANLREELEESYQRRLGDYWESFFAFDKQQGQLLENQGPSDVSGYSEQKEELSIEEEMLHLSQVSDTKERYKQLRTLEEKYRRDKTLDSSSLSKRVAKLYLIHMYSLPHPQDPALTRRLLDAAVEAIDDDLVLGEIEQELLHQVAGENALEKAEEGIELLKECAKEKNVFVD